MISAPTWERLADKLTPQRANQPIVLDGGAVCYVESGSAGLFRAEVSAGAPSGPRRFLHRLGSGQAAFSAPASSRDKHRLLVVPIQSAVVRIVPFRALWADMKEQETSLAPLIEEWVDILARLLTGYPEPEDPILVPAGADLELEDGQTITAEPGVVLWATLDTGALEWMGAENLTVQARSIPIPITAGMWARASGRVQLRTSLARDVVDSNTVASGLAHLQALVHRHFKEREKREAGEELERLRERHNSETERSSQAIEELVSALEGPRVAPLVGTPLFKAFSAVSRSMGVDAVSPPRAHGRADPLDVIARASRVRTRKVALRSGWWKSDCGSFIAYTNDDEHRPVALLRKRSGNYEIYDPVENTKTRLDAQTARGLARDADTIFRPLPEGPLTLIDLLRFSVAGRQRDLGLVLFTGVAATLLAMITPHATAILMDHAIPDANNRLILEIGAGLFAAALGITIFYVAQGLLLLRFEIGSEADSQAALWDRLLRLRPSFFRDFSSGDLQSRVMAVSDVSRELSGVTLSTLFSSSLAFLNLGLLYYYSPRLCLLAVCVAAVVMVVTVGASALMRPKVRELVELEGQFFGHVVQVINGVSKLRVARAEERAFAHWMGYYNRQLKLWATTDRIADALFVINRLIPTLAAVLLFVFSFQMLQEGRQAGGPETLTLGTFLAFTTAFAVFLGGATSLSNTIVRLVDVSAKSERIRPIMQAEPEIDQHKTDPGRLSGRLALSNVDFRYRADGLKILDDVSIRAEPGEFIAIVGPSGSGKSTIFRLLLGFEKPDSGTVSHDGQDLASIDVLAVRRQMGVVLQSGVLDTGSIFENISSGNIITLDEAWAAAEAAGFAEEIREMPMGMHTIVSVGGGNLSGGQRQRLLIARALAPRPRVLLFDEATSALDNHTQALVSESLEGLKVTRIVIAHRLSTIKNADRIYVLDGGKIAQSGRYEELMEREGLFKALMARQVA